jgi:hypothetical protein
LFCLKLCQVEESKDEGHQQDDQVVQLIHLRAALTATINKK